MLKIYKNLFNILIISFITLTFQDVISSGSTFAAAVHIAVQKVYSPAKITYYCKYFNNNQL
jgi:hypothetical protein